MYILITNENAFEPCPLSQVIPVINLKNVLLDLSVLLYILVCPYGNMKLYLRLNQKEILLYVFFVIYFDFQ